MFKKTITIIAFVIILTTFSFASANNIQVYLDNALINLSGKAVMENGRVLVPMRSIFETIGASVNWDGTNNLITSAKGNTKIALQIGNKNMGLNGKLVALDVAPKIESGRTLVPVRVISESFGYKVNWDNSKSIVYIVSGNSNNPSSYAPEEEKNIEVIDSFDWVSPSVVLSYYEVVGGRKIYKTTNWNEPINKEITINSNGISYMQCIDEIDFRNKVFTGYGWSRNLAKGTKVTLLKIGKMYPDTLYVRLADGTQGVIYRSSY